MLGASYLPEYLTYCWSIQYNVIPVRFNGCHKLYECWNNFMIACSQIHFQGLPLKYVFLCEGYILII